MKAFLTAVIAVVVIMVGAWAALNETGFSSAERQTSPAVRID